MSEKIQLLTTPISSTQQIESNYISMSFKESYKTPFQFSIMLPKTWKTYPNTISNYPSSDTPVGLIGKASNINAEIEVWCTLIPRELHPADWLHLWIQTQDYVTQDSRTTPTAYGIVGDCVAQKKINGEEHTCRLFTIKDKNRIFFVVAKTPTEYYKKYEEAFLLAIQSFKLLNPTKELYAEPFKEKSIKKPYNIVLRFPQLWEKTTEHPESDNEMSFSLLNKIDTTVMGQINIVLLSAKIQTSPINMLENWLSKLAINQLDIEGSPNTLTEKEINNKKLITWQGKASSAGVPMELHSTIVLHSRGALMANLITPPPTNNYEAWAINRRSYEIIFSTAQY